MTSTPAPPAGRREVRDGTSYVAFTRTFRAPVTDVWAAVTEPERLARWIGTWTGDPASGEVAFRMTAEGEDVAEETYRIDACEPPRRLVVRTSVGDDGGEWQLELDLAESEGVTTLTFAQVMADPDVAESVGPGWDYYLDRLVVAEAGRDVAEVVWDDYYPARSGFYRAAFS
ncbi:SRPBCC family protein [Nocardioides sp. 503]|uniref:SRPBCC family protein n=1 Tax=Nocardioides sp. 503 TaxID=2508326 RepID=UPI00106F6C37|nr:SRPBCC family protein [Nocardioides sp. 503]